MVLFQNSTWNFEVLLQVGILYQYWNAKAQAPVDTWLRPAWVIGRSALKKHQLGRSGLESGAGRSEADFDRPGELMWIDWPDDNAYYGTKLLGFTSNQPSKVSSTTDLAQDLGLKPVYRSFEL